MPMPWERNWGGIKSPALPPADNDVETYIRQAATARGIPVEDALAVWAGEGKGAWQSNFHKGGQREPSYGPYQLYMGGGLGNAFQKDTGLDPSDPSTWRQGVDYALDTAKKEGWKQWYGAPQHLRARGGYEEVDLQGPAFGAMGKPLPWQRQWGSGGTPKAEEKVAPQEQTAGDFRLEDKWTPPSPPVTAGGLLKAGASGLQEGVTALAGLPGDIRHYATKIGVPENMPLGPLVPQGAPTSEQLQGAYEAVGGPTYTPQNTAEEYTKTLGSFVPNAIGGAGLLRRGAQVAIPAVLSETGGQVGRTISPQAETAGRLAGALTGAGRTSSPRTPKGVTSSEEIKALSQEAYDAAENAGLQIKGESFYNFAQSLAKDKVVKSLTINPELHSKLSGLYKEIAGLVVGPQKQPTMTAMTGVKRQWSPPPMSLQDFDNTRRNALNVAMRSPDADERRIAGHIVDRLDDYFDNLKSLDVAAGDPRAAGAAVKQARDLWRKYRKSEEIEIILEKAKDDTGRFSLSGKENAIRTGFRNLSKKIAADKRVANRFTDEEKKIIRQLSRGWTGRGALTMIGKLAPNAISLAGGVTSYGLGADPTYIGGASILGMASRGAAGAMASRKARELQKLVGGGGKKIPGGRGIVPLSGVSATAQEDK